MAFATSLRNTTLAVFSSALLIYFGNGLHPMWPLMWFAPLPVLLYSLKARNALSAAAVAFAAMLLGSLNLWSYLTHTLNAPPIAWAAMFLPASALFAAGVFLFRALALRRFVWAALVALPSAWVTAEYLRNLFSVHGTAGNLAYSQLNFLPFLQLASVTGPWGMSFVLLLLPSATALAFRFRNRDTLLIIVASLLLALTVVLFGFVRLATTPQPTAKIGLMASDLRQNAQPTDPGPKTERLFLDYAREAVPLIQRGAQVIVIPEKLAVTIEGRTAASDTTFQTLADQTGVTLVAGVIHVAPPGKFNEARIFIPQSPIARYHKQHMLPPFESNLQPGTSLLTLPHPTALWGVAICKDMDFESPSSAYGQQGVGLLLVPAWDFVVDDAWHGHIAIMRGVEDGFTVARAAKSGLLTVSDNRGRILAETSSSAAPFATLLVDAPTTHNDTLYQRLGDWCAWLAIALLLWALSKLT